MRRCYLYALTLACITSSYAQSTFNIAINPNTKYQTIADFGASDCWTAEYVGRYFNDIQKKQAAEWLFSKDIESDGKPKGIGLSAWRINLGAGSAEQSAASNIADESRRVECYLNSDGTYNWNKAQGQQFFMQQAKQYGVEHFVLFSNSAPVYMTKNGLANNKNNASNANLKDDAYDKFAEFLATCAEHFTTKGYPITYISPVNEPAFNWTDGQEGSPWQNKEISKLVRELDKSLSNHSLSALIMTPEASSWDRTYQHANDYGGRASNQIEAFWNPANADTYIGNLSHIAKIVAGHDYWTFGSNNALITTRTKALTAAQKYGLQLMQTEWSMLDREPSAETGFPSSYDAASDMDIALFMGKLIHIGLTQGNMISWSYWTAMAQSRYSQKNRFELLRLNATGDNGYESYGDIKNGGTVTATPNLWVLGNFSRFIRPGYCRISLTGADDINSLMGSAYLSPNGKEVIAVFVNMKNVAKGIKMNNDSFVQNVSSVKAYITDKDNNLTPDLSFTNLTTRNIIKPRSVVTLVFNLSVPMNVKAIQADKSAQQEGIFNLCGQKAANSSADIDKLPEGIYIINGTKISK